LCRVATCWSVVTKGNGQREIRRRQSSSKGRVVEVFIRKETTSQMYGDLEAMWLI
jgi:hypothetical protein